MVVTMLPNPLLSLSCSGSQAGRGHGVRGRVPIPSHLSSLNAALGSVPNHLHFFF